MFKETIMNIDEFIDEAVFSENETYKCFYTLIWDSFKESGYVITD